MGKDIRLKLGEDNRYHAKYMLLGFIPIGVDELEDFALSTEEIDEKIYLINEHIWAKKVIGVKVEKKPISKAWMERIGKYELVNRQQSDMLKIKQITAKVEDRYPVIELEMESGEKLSYILELVNENEAIIEGIGRSARETIRVVDGEFFYSGLRFRKVEEK